MTPVLAAFVACTNSVGTSDEVLTGTHGSAVIFEPDGKTPAKGAVVKVFKADAVDGQYVSHQTTGNVGRYSIKGLPLGTYNIWAEKDSLALFQNKVVIAATDTTLRNDTLASSSSITGFINIQPQDDPRTVTLQVIGLDKSFSNIDRDGRFTLQNMAEGNYSLLLKSTLPNYTPTKIEIKVDAGKDDTLNYSLPMMFTGIPVVTGIVATYDTVKGSVLLSWNATDYRDMQAYLVYRDFYDSVVFSSIPCAAPIDTFFTDRIYSGKTVDGPFSHSDTNDYHFRYRVAVRNNVNDIGPTFRGVDIMAASPFKVRSSFTFFTRHCAKGFISKETLDSVNCPGIIVAGSASINDSMIVIAQVSNPTRNFARVTWRDSAGNVVRVAKCDTTRRNAIDSVSCRWATLGLKYVICTVMDNAGVEWIDTARVLIVEDVPSMKLTISDSAFVLNDSAISSARYAFNDTIPVHISFFDRFGTIAKTEWSFGENASRTFQRAVLDTFAIAPGAAADYRISARTVDDDGNAAGDTLGVSINVFAPATYGAVFKPRMKQKSVVFNDKMWIFGGIGFISDMDSGGRDYSIASETWHSDNGVKWTKENSNLPARTDQSLIVFNDKLWSIGGVSMDSLTVNDVWSSSDGIAWTRVTDSAAFSPRSAHSCLVFDNKLWVIGGRLGGTKRSDVWYSSDGKNWSRGADSLDFLSRIDLCLVHDGKIWAIAGQDATLDTAGYDRGGIWSSTDGVVWTQAENHADVTLSEGCGGMVYDKKIWIIGDGRLNGESGTPELWNSADGITWTPLSAAIPGFPDRVFHSSVVFKNRLWVIAGQTRGNGCANDVWRSGPLTE